MASETTLYKRVQRLFRARVDDHVARERSAASAGHPTDHSLAPVELLRPSHPVERGYNFHHREGLEHELRDLLELSAIRFANPIS